VVGRGRSTTRENRYQCADWNYEGRAPDAAVLRAGKSIRERAEEAAAVNNYATARIKSSLTSGGNLKWDFDYSDCLFAFVE
jgi:hypothetical protein